MVEHFKIPTGYKKTEIAVIPPDWSVKEFQEVMTGFSSGATPYRGRLEYYKGKTKWITSGELNYNVIADTFEHVTDEAVRNTNLKILPIGTFLMAITGLEAEGTRGSCGITGVEATTNQSCMALFPKDTLDNGYLYHYYVWQGKMLAFKYCQGTKQQSYTGKIVRTLPIIIPSTKSEQTAIAIALSDTDAFIKNLEKLIAKKRNIEQGVMQELLTGRKRLTGFEDEWGNSKIGDILKVRHGRSQKDVQNESGIYPILGSGGLIGYANEYLYDSESVLIGRKGTIDKPRFMNCPFWTVDTLFYTEIKKGYSPKFIYYKFLLIDWYSYNEASGVPSLNAKTIENIEMVIPSYETQLHIAQILTDVDDEIEALEQKLHKYRMIKQGMMQVLLTGKIRLI